MIVTFIENWFSNYDDFLLSSSRNVWVSSEAIDIYVRKSQRCVADRAIECIDIAHVIIDADYQNRGIFTSILAELIERYPTTNFYAESVINAAALHVLKKFDFTVHQMDYSIAPAGIDLYRLAAQEKINAIQ